MTAKKRDQPHHDLVQQYLPSLIPDTVLGITRELGYPYDVKPGLGGMTPADAVGITISGPDKWRALIGHATLLCT